MRKDTKHRSEGGVEPHLRLDPSSTSDDSEDTETTQLEDGQALAMLRTRNIELRKQLKVTKKALQQAEVAAMLAEE